MSILSNLKYINLGGPGGKLLQPGTVAEVLYAFQNLVSLGSYPFMGQVRFHIPILENARRVPSNPILGGK